MPITDILVTLVSYPEPTPVAALDDALALAVALKARISAIACEVKLRVPGNILGKTLVDIPAMAAEEHKKRSAYARGLLASFKGAATRLGVFQECILEKCHLSEVANALVEHARLRDLTIVPMPDRDLILKWDTRWYAESIIFGSGHPTLLLPYTDKSVGTFALNTAVIAWDFSRPAARAIADSIPILARAKQTRIVTVINEKAIQTKRSGADLAKHLALHGIEAVLDVVDAAGRPIGGVLADYMRSHNGDLLVMGAYGHSRTREFILGGATRSMITHPYVPVFLSH